jgi:hypothetical protein
MGPFYEGLEKPKPPFVDGVIMALLMEDKKGFRPS